MQLQFTNRSDILAALKSATQQIDLVHKLTLDVNDMYQAVLLDINDENAITEIANNDQWPVAVDPALIAKNHDDKMLRADGVVYLFLQNGVSGKRVLDFGCGEGHVSVVAANQGAAISVGYDMKANHSWESHQTMPNLIFTTDEQQVTANAPYDWIVLYDVLDHSADPVDVLKQCGTLLAAGGKICVRCHPWCSRHGGHIYKSLNKAYAHMVLSEAAVYRLSNGELPHQRVIHPMRSYNEWIDRAALKIVNRDIVKDPVEDFFSKGKWAATIMSQWKNSPLLEYATGTVFPSFPMSQQFVDFVLSKQ